MAVAKSGSAKAAARLLDANLAAASPRINRFTPCFGAAPFARKPEGWRASPQVAGPIELASAFVGPLAAEIDSSRLPCHELQRASVRLGAALHHQLRPDARLVRSARLSGVALKISDRFAGESLGEFNVIVRVGAPKAGRLRTKRVASLAHRLFRRIEGPPGWPR